MRLLQCSIQGGTDFRLIAIICGVAAMVLLAVSSLPAQPINPRTEPLRADRLMKFFDFEEEVAGATRKAKVGQFSRLPRHWYVIGDADASRDPNFLRQPLHQQLMRREGFPRHGVIRFDNQHKVSGDYSLHLGLNGGNSGAYVSIGALAAVPQSDYMISMKVRTSKLRHARAKVTAYFVNSHGFQVAQSVVHSALINTKETWQTVQLKLEGDYDDVAWIGLQLELLQAEPDPDAPLGKHQIVYRDVTGGAWFDDIAVWQLPQVGIKTQSKVNIIRAPQKPRLFLNVRDLTGQPLVSQIRVYDHRLKLLDEQTQPVGRGLSPTWRWTPTLPGYGWYFVDLKIKRESEKETEQFLSREMLAMLWLPPTDIDPVISQAVFALNAEGRPQEQLELLPNLLDQTDLNAAIISVWDRQTTLDTILDRQEKLDTVMNQISGAQRGVIMSLHPLPNELQQTLQIDANHPILMFDVNRRREDWLSYLKPMTLRYSQLAMDWQLSSTAKADVNFSPDWQRLLPSVQSSISGLIPQARPWITWPVRQALPKSIPDLTHYAVQIPTTVRPESIVEHLKPWERFPDAHVRADLEVEPATRRQHQDRINDLARRMLYAWEAGVDGMAMYRPWTTTRGTDVDLVPDPLLGVYASIAQRLRGYEVVSRLPLERGQVALILNGPRGGMIAAWNDSTPVKKSVMKMYLGENPVVYDVWGNRSPVKTEGRKHVINVTRTPIFIEGINPQLAVLRSSFTIDEPFFESTQQTQRRTLTIYNPWPSTITGRIRIDGYDSWHIQPRMQSFSIPSGGRQSFPIAVRFPVSQTAGEQKLIAGFEFAADQDYKIDAATDIEIGLREVDFKASVALRANPETGKTQAIVTQLITNRSDEPMSLSVYADFSGSRRREQTVPRLKPGQTIVRRFTFSDAAAIAQGQKIRVGLREAGGPASLSMFVGPDS